MKRLATLAVLLAVAGIASAQPFYYDFQGFVDDSWNDPNNWLDLASPYALDPNYGTPAGLPAGLGEIVYIRDAVTCTLDGEGTGWYDPSFAPSLNVGASPYYLNGDPNQGILWRDKSTLVVEPNAHLTPGAVVTGAVIEVAREYDGQIIQNGGVVELANRMNVGIGGPVSYTDPNMDGRVSGTYTMNGGSLWNADPVAQAGTKPQLYIGRDGGMGTFIMNGGEMPLHDVPGVAGSVRGVQFNVGANGDTGWDATTDATYGRLVINGGTIDSTENWAIGASGGEGDMIMTNGTIADVGELQSGWGRPHGSYPASINNSSTGYIEIGGSSVVNPEALNAGYSRGTGNILLKDNAVVTINGGISNTNIDSHTNFIGRAYIYDPSTVGNGSGTLTIQDNAQLVYAPTDGSDVEGDLNGTTGTISIGYNNPRSYFNVTTQSDGLINITGGLMQINTGGTVAAASQTLALGRSYLQRPKGNGTGQMVITGGSFMTVSDPNGAAVGNVLLAMSPDTTGRLTVGKNAYVSIAGDLLMIPNDDAGAVASLAVEVGNGGNSLITVSGTAKLADTLSVDLVDPNYRPEQDDTFVIIAAGTAPTGSFTTLNDNVTQGLVVDPNGTFYPAWEASIVGNNVQLRFTGAKKGDANGDNAVNGGDLALMGGNWMQTTGQNWAGGDFNGDGAVNGGDLALMGGNWMWSEALPPAPGAAVPEPATLALLGLGGLALIRRRK